MQRAAQQMSHSNDPTGALVAIAAVLRVTDGNQQLPRHERRQAERDEGEEQIPRRSMAERDQDALGAVLAP